MFGNAYGDDGLKVGDFVMGAAGTCEKCKGQKVVAMVYGEKVPRDRSASRWRGTKDAQP